jgi:SulP family sulfate permease
MDTFYSKSEPASPVRYSLAELDNEDSENEEQELITTQHIIQVQDITEDIPLLQDTLPITKNWHERVLGEAVFAMPAVLLATMLTLLDAISYGIIIFPASDIHLPTTAPHAGISMFLASTIISQIVYTAGGSAFKGAVGSMVILINKMIEVMPFLHIICSIIETKMKNSSDKEILATIMAAYAMSTLITGIVFLLLGIYKLGNVIQFFPRHILVGCIGGIGLFLILTGIEITAKIEPIITLQYFIDIFEWKALKLWGVSLGVAITLKTIQEFIEHPLLVPVFYMTVPLVFYSIVVGFGLNLEDLRNQGWLFKFDTVDVPFYVFWTYYDFFNVNWNAVMATIPTQLALTFFGILHVPINVPALSVSTKQDVDLSKEIIGHGISNIAAGMFGVTQNYMVYSNSLLYIRSGGNSTTAGVILILATVLLWIKGSFLILYVPSIVVGSLIFHLGIDLIKESVYDTWSVGMHPLEYFTIITIVLVMGGIL